MTIELEAKFVRGRGSVDEYLEQTAIANPHVALHYIDPEGNLRDYAALGRQAAAGAEGNQAASVRRRAGPAGDDAAGRPSDDVSQFLTSSFSRVSPAWRSKICKTAKISTAREHAKRIGRKEADALYQAIQETQDRLAGDRLHLARSARS